MNDVITKRPEPPTKQEIERFQSYCIKDGDCIIWTGYKDRDGYGQMTLRRYVRKTHRVALWIAGRPVPQGHVVNHSCRRRDCVNPQHLTVITASENSLRDSRSAGYINSQKTHCREGHLYDRHYGKQRYCSQCEAAKSKRLREKWKREGIERI